MPKRPKPKIKSSTETKSPSPSQLRRRAKHAAQLERETYNKTTGVNPWAEVKFKRRRSRKSLQESYKVRMEKASNYKSKGKDKLTPNDNILKGTLSATRP